MRTTGNDIISSILIARVSVEPTALVKHIICCDENVVKYPCADASKATGLRIRDGIRGLKHHRSIWNYIPDPTPRMSKRVEDESEEIPSSELQFKADRISLTLLHLFITLTDSLENAAV